MIGQTERDLLGALIVTPALVAEVAGNLDPADLEGEGAELLRRLLAAAESGAPVTVETIGAEGGLRELADELAAGAALLLPEVARELARRLRERARKRRVLAALQGAGRQVVEANDDALDASLDAALAAVVAAADGAPVEGAHAGDDLLADAIRRAADAGARLADVTPTGLADLDFFLAGGLRPGRVLVVGARPGVGKSALALSVARHVARSGHRVAIASLEMDAAELGDRLLAAEGRLDLRALQAGDIGQDGLRRAVEAHAGARGWAGNLAVLDRVQTVAGMSAAIRRMELQRRPVRVLIVDYLQLARGSRRQDRRLEVAEVSTELKRLARQRRVAVVLLSQLNRNADGRPATSGPELADLYESGQVEADADGVLLLWSDGSPGLLRARLAKNRSGPCGRIDFAWRAAACEVRNLAAADAAAARTRS